ncbi:MAG: hypothetical protein O3A19_04085 [Planctomycetota bacterium]|nr:hypothetical protein [Planctomycetota bacterium]MDA1025587.1 hypothetical protein [Planctomycetota bacterium]
MTSSLTKAHPSIDALLAAEPIIEPDGPLRFGSRRGRDEHVRKHVLAARDERWRQLLGQDLISAALSNGREAGAAFEALAIAYEALLAERLHDAVVTGCRHVHFVAFELAPATKGARVLAGFLPFERVVVAWSPLDKLRIVAGIPVRSGQVERYTLRSGFRHDVDASVGRFGRAVKSRVLERGRHHQERVTAVHDGENEWAAISK